MAGRPGVGWTVVVLTSGNHVVASTVVDNGAFSDAGAATFGLGSTNGRTITQTNSLFGFKGAAGLSGIVVDSTHSSFAASFLNDAGGRVRLGPLASFTLVSIVDIAGDQGAGCASRS